MDIKYFKRTFIAYYSSLIVVLTIYGFKWSKFFDYLHGPDRDYLFLIFILPAILIWGAYFILRK